MRASFLERFSHEAVACQAEKRLTFLRSNGDSLEQWTHRDLYERAIRLAGRLQRTFAAGDRALLLFPPGLEFIAAFCGCLYAGLISVPVPSPDRKRALQGLLSIIQASDPAVILTTSDQHRVMGPWIAEFPELQNRRWILCDGAGHDDEESSWTDPLVVGSHPALLQFTSGSTSSPKGVIVSHDNLLANAKRTREAFGLSTCSHVFSWLPHYHDMGLIGGILQSLHDGYSVTLTAPVSFVQRPLLWLESISRLGCTVSGGPNFAFELCVRKIRTQDCVGLDLSSWSVAFVGSEPVRRATIDDFSRKFSPFGFRRDAFLPCYGLAESTLLVAAGPRQLPPRLQSLNLDALGRRRVVFESEANRGIQTVVSCGRNLCGPDLKIVHPETRQGCDEHEVGEVWLRGPSVAAGYFRSPEHTATTFEARLQSGEGPWLRTGDLGFLSQGELFVTGRLKDVMIIRGRNLHPEDIESLLREAHAAFRVGFCAVFSVVSDSVERLVVVQELEPRLREFDADEALRRIREIIAAQFELEVSAIELVRAGEIPRTTSGKIQRAGCRARWLAGELQSVAHWRSAVATDDVVSTASEQTREVFSGVKGSRSVAAVEEWLVSRIASRAGLPAAQIRVSTPFLEFGLGSIDAVELANDLGAFVGRPLTPTMIYNHPTISAVARWLAELRTQQADGPLAIPGDATQTPSFDQIQAEVQQMSEAELEEFLSIQWRQDSPDFRRETSPERS